MTEQKFKMTDRIVNSEHEENTQKSPKGGFGTTC